MYYLSSYNDNGMYVFEFRGDSERSEAKFFHSAAAYKKFLSLFLTDCELSGKKYSWE